MHLTWLSMLLGGCAAILAGFSKTGLPGAAVPAVALLAVAFLQKTEWVNLRAFDAIAQVSSGISPSSASQCSKAKTVDVNGSFSEV